MGGAGAVTGGFAAASGGAPTGGTATGGLTQTGGSAGVGGGPAAPLGKSIWFRRGLLELGATAFEKHLGSLLGKGERPTPRYPSTRLIEGDHQPKEVEDMVLLSRGQTAAEGLSDSELLALFDCDPSPVTCSEDSLLRFVRRAWHGQGSAIELAEIEKALTAVADLPPASQLKAVREILRTILSSPNAYVLRQLGQPVSPGVYELDAWERANLLAWGAGALTGDDALFEAADSDALLDPGELRVHAERLLNAAAGQRVVVDFVRGWFGMKSPQELEASWGSRPTDAPSAASMYGETQYVVQALFAANAPVSELLSADYTFVDSSLAAFYGLPFQGTGFVRTDLRGTPRRGLLHHAGWLASTSHSATPSYPARALGVLNLLCENPPPPPASINVSLPDPGPGLTRRERMELATVNPACASCHKVLDPIGFSFDHFDGVGRYQETENGLALDTSGSLRTFAGRSFVFDSSTSLALQLAADPGLARCYASNLAAHWVGASPGDPAANDYGLRWDFAAREKGLRDAILAWLESPHFFTRSE